MQGAGLTTEALALRAQIGYLTREFAGEVVARSAKGWEFRAVIAGIGRAGGVGPYGVRS